MRDTFTLDPVEVILYDPVRSCMILCVIICSLFILFLRCLLLLIYCLRVYTKNCNQYIIIYGVGEGDRERERESWGLGGGSDPYPMSELTQREFRECLIYK